VGSRYITAIDNIYNIGYSETVNSKPPNRVPGMSIYLGSDPDRSRRVEALKRLAEQLHVTTSEMFRMLADGELSIIVTPPRIAVSQSQNPNRTIQE